MSDREYWRPHVRSKRFPAIRYAPSSTAASPGSFIKITCRGEKASSQFTGGNENEEPRSERSPVTGQIRPASFALCQRKYRTADLVRSSESTWLPSVRSMPTSQRLRDIPGIYVSPAPKCTRKSNRGSNLTSSSKKYYHRSINSNRDQRDVENYDTNVTGSSQPVTIPALDNRMHPEIDSASEDQTSIAGKTIGMLIESKDKATMRDESSSSSLCPKLINLNKGFADISSKFGENVALHDALSRKFTSNNRMLSKLSHSFHPKSRNLPTASAQYLPLREVYLKSAIADGRDPLEVAQNERNSRIWNWLKKLNYLDEIKRNSQSTVESET